MLTGVADLLLSTLRSGGFDKVREEEEFKIFKPYPQKLLPIYPQTRYLRIEPANTFTEYTTRLAKRTLNTP